MIAKLSRSWLAIAAVALVQTSALFWIVYDRVSLLRNGREIVVKVIPVDPRDLFRGDYVVLGYSFTRTGDISVPGTTRKGDRLFAILKPATDDDWELVRVETAYPDNVDEGHVVLMGRARSVFKRGPDNVTKASIRYGIESYFIPEGTGKSLEEKVRDRKIAAVIAVGGGGEAAIKALMVDGERVAAEPLL
jgi:uncharacterized membrane-anchored protein